MVRYLETIWREFQSTPSGGKATIRVDRSALNIRVSIHAFRGEGDPDDFVTALR